LTARAIGLCMILAVPLSLHAQEVPKRATLQDGSVVLIYPDGTWRSESAVPKKRPSSNPKLYAKPSNATETISVLKTASFSYDPNKWKQTTSREPGRLTFTHVSGDGYAMVIYERLQLTPATLKRVVLGNAHEAAPDAKIASEEKRTVNGVELMCLQITGTVQGIPIRYFGYYYAGQEGSIQVLTYSGNNLFDEYQADFEELLNGFEAPTS